MLGKVDMHRIMPEAMARQLVELPKSTKLGLILSVDFVLLVLSIWLAYAIRLGEWFVPNGAQLALLVSAPILTIAVFFKFGIYRSVIRYLSERVLWALAKGMMLAVLLWASLAFMTQMTGMEVPRGVPILYGLIAIVLVSGSRFFARWVLWFPVRTRDTERRLLIYGAGGAGRQLAASLKCGRELFPIGFIDDDIGLQGKDVDDLRVYAPSKLSWLIEHFDVNDVIVTLPSASSARRREVVALLERYPLRVRILPSLTDIANGRHLVSMVRQVDIGDLLGRDPVKPDQTLLGSCITNKVVLVTGAGGSIGSELCRQVAVLEPARIVLLEHSEHALYQIERSLRNMTDCQLIPCLGSVANKQLVADILKLHSVQTIYHAAAYKHVPLVESNVLEGVRNNVLGTRVLARAALEAGIETFILISTDKAVRPTNVMGATKRWAELIVQDFARQARIASRNQRFCAVRFGNVLGSSGSVIPLFKEQIANGGPVTITHPEVTRYFMSIHEAVQLVIQAGSLAEGGEIFLLDMGEPVKIVDLARNMIRLAGHSFRDASNSDGDIEIEIIGLRPGEKLYEELLISESNAEGTQHSKIMKANEPCVEGDLLASHLARLDSAIVKKDEIAMRSLLMEVAM